MSLKDPVAAWHQIVASRDVRALDHLLADDCVFHSPVLHSPQLGKARTMMYLGAAFHVFFNPSFHYVREVTTGHDAILEFMVEIDGIVVNGVDMLHWNDQGRITEFKVMIRPLKAVQLIQARMAAMLEALKPSA